MKTRHHSERSNPNRKPRYPRLQLKWLREKQERLIDERRSPTDTFTRKELQ